MKKIFLIIHIVIAVGLLLTGYSYLLNPTTFGIIALSGYAFPAFLVLTLLSISLAVLTRKRHLVVPFIALVLAYQPVMLYTPFHTESTPPAEALTIVSYNTHHWGTSSTPEGVGSNDNGKAVMEYLLSTNADIICLQESPFSNQVQQNLDTLLFKEYKHHKETKLKNGNVLTIISRYPIIKSDTIAYASKGNGSAAFWLQLKDRKLIVVNNHLETTGLSLEDRTNFSNIIHGKDDDYKDTSKGIFRKLLGASRLRVPQAEAVQRFVMKNKLSDGGTPIIVCGDINDIPNSYVHHVLSKNMTDCYTATATGPGYSFSHYGMRVRIDNVMCTPDITPHNFRVDDSITLSDHYPIIGQLEL